MSNQTQIPVIQTSSADLSQIQQNVNKVARNIYGQLLETQMISAPLALLGTVVFSTLTVTQFQALLDTTWILCNGQTCVGTAYATDYGHNTAPNISITGVNAFIKVN